MLRMPKPMGESELKPKVKAMYDAVLELLNENADVNTMTVSDITKKAGIGKGTAYEYFKTKEEIIAGAVMYDAQKQGEESWERLETIENFEEKIRYCYRWVVECVQEQRAFARFMLLSVQTGGIRETLLKQMQKLHEDCREGACMSAPMAILQGMCEQGKMTGSIRADISAEEAAYMLLGSLTSLVMYLGKQNKETEFEPEKMRDLLCEGFLATVRGKEV